MKLATIDVGTNTTLLLVAEGSGPADVRVLEDRAEITRLGRGIGKDGGLGAEGIARTLAVLDEYARAGAGARRADRGRRHRGPAPGAQRRRVPAAGGAPSWARRSR